MKNIGMVRQVDELGRIVIPFDLRREGLAKETQLSFSSMKKLSI